MIEEIKKLIEQYEEEVAENQEIWGEDMEDFNPMDASGGNFDDCYYMGLEHGQTEGKLEILYMVLKKLEKQSNV